MRSSKVFITVAAAAVLLTVAMPASAVDGCKVLLCLAGPWQSIPACVGDVEQLFQDLWNGDPFPSCALANGRVPLSNLSNASGAGVASASNTWLAQWAAAPDPECPSPYVTLFSELRMPRYGCRYVGVIPLYVGGQLWSRTYWSVGQASVTELAPHPKPLAGLQSESAAPDATAALRPIVVGRR
jgi:hypothetical protein